MSVSAYKRVQRDHESPRSVERRIFSRITADLETWGQAYDRAEDGLERLTALKGSLQLALSENMRLWALLRRDLSAPENALPTELKASIISISLTVDRLTSEILRGHGQVADLVGINRPFIDGLAGISGAEG
ncbi:flagellar biosynthesis regulator FlaF [Falsigemmobacter faecalis]|uniref:FlaF protein n=1 Tax=Falsigemmobacter faecalis TaxID=2488730 RepID=A0A3P3DNF7_9RHOB|nr:flagellar biosynthesis regulator FlaF [Falsigemmobacter faecalis]RRH75773.1 flaF protein [Falsigemmobacter faecalis]